MKKEELSQPAFCPDWVKEDITRLLDGDLHDVMGSEEQLSDCCSASVYAPSTDWAICWDCKEHCDVVSPE